MTPERAVHLVKYGRSTTKAESQADITKAIAFVRAHPDLWSLIDWNRK